MDKKIRAIVIGRHTPDFGNLQVEVVELKPVTFPQTGKEALGVLYDLFAEAIKKDACVLLQNSPAQVTAALVEMWDWQDQFSTSIPEVGIVVSVPGPRPAGVEKSFAIGYGDAVPTAAEAVRFANPRATVVEGSTNITVTVDPPMPFVFSHIEWMHRPGGRNNS